MFRTHNAILEKENKCKGAGAAPLPCQEKYLCLQFKYTLRFSFQADEIYLGYLQLDFSGMNIDTN